MKPCVSGVQWQRTVSSTVLDIPDGHNLRVPIDKHFLSKAQRLGLIRLTDGLAPTSKSATEHMYHIPLIPREGRLVFGPEADSSILQSHSIAVMHDSSFTHANDLDAWANMQALVTQPFESDPRTAGFTVHLESSIRNKPHGLQIDPLTAIGCNIASNESHGANRRKVPSFQTSGQTTNPALHMFLEITKQQLQLIHGSKARPGHANVEAQPRACCLVERQLVDTALPPRQPPQRPVS